MSIDFNRDFEIEYGRCDTLSPLIRRVVCNNPSPFTFRGTGTYIIGRGTVAVIDPGPMDNAHLEALTAALEGEQVSHIVITHTHSDHSPLAEPLKLRTGADIYAYGVHERAQDASGDVALDGAADAGFAPDHLVRHGDEIEGDGWTLEAVFTPGHMSNHTGFALAQEKTLFVGDHVMAWSTSVITPPDGDMADYMASLDLLLTREDETYWPTHGPAITKPRPHVEAFITHRREREAAVLERIKAGDRTIADMVPRIYAGLDPKLFAAAGLSVKAHIRHLIEQGLIVPVNATDPEAGYRAV
jgi:glyoxylase-like metal-dependent hydrolase (beta-lactamase superfamily II)